MEPAILLKYYKGINHKGLKDFSQSTQRNLSCNYSLRSLRLLCVLCGKNSFE